MKKEYSILVLLCISIFALYPSDLIDCSIENVIIDDLSLTIEISIKNNTNDTYWLHASGGYSKTLIDYNILSFSPNYSYHGVTNNNGYIQKIDLLEIAPKSHINTIFNVDSGGGNIEIDLDNGLLTTSKPLDFSKINVVDIVLVFTDKKVELPISSWLYHDFVISKCKLKGLIYVLH